MLHLGIFLHAANLQHGADGFTSPPKEGVLRIILPLKIRRLRPGLNPQTWVLKASTLTPGPPKPLVNGLLSYPGIYPNIYIASHVILGIYAAALAKCSQV